MYDVWACATDLAVRIAAAHPVGEPILVILANRRNQPKGWSRSAAKIMRVVLTANKLACACHLVSLGDRNLKVPRSEIKISSAGWFHQPLAWASSCSHLCAPLVGTLRVPPFAAALRERFLQKPTRLCEGHYVTYYAHELRSLTFGKVWACCPKQLVLQWGFPQWNRKSPGLVEMKPDWSSCRRMRWLDESLRLWELISVREGMVTKLA